MTETPQEPTPEAAPAPKRVFTLINGGEASPTTVRDGRLAQPVAPSEAQPDAQGGTPPEEGGEPPMVSLAGMPPIPLDPWIASVLELGEFHRTNPPATPGVDLEKLLVDRDRAALGRAIGLLNAELGVRASARCKVCRMPINVDMRCWGCPLLNMLTTSVAALEDLAAGNLSVRARVRRAKEALDDVAPALLAFKDMRDRLYPQGMDGEKPAPPAPATELTPEQRLAAAGLVKA